jgi:septum formation topological specificity factor MinE
MLEIEFYDMEKEIEEITRILNARPDLITFNSNLMDEVVKISKRFVEIEGDKVEVDTSRVLDMLRDVENLEFELSPELILLVKEKILFVDPVNRTVRP